MKYLGVTFGTKYLYFVSLAAASNGDHTDHTRVAPVLDDVVRRWLSVHSNVQLRLYPWIEREYARFIELLDTWGGQLDLPRDRVEELIFRHQISRDASPLWSEPWLEETVARTGPIADVRNRSSSCAKRCQRFRASRTRSMRLRRASIRSLQSLIGTAPSPPIANSAVRQDTDVHR